MRSLWTLLLLTIPAGASALDVGPNLRALLWSPEPTLVEGSLDWNGTEPVLISFQPGGAPTWFLEAPRIHLTVYDAKWYALHGAEGDLRTPWEGSDLGAHEEWLQDAAALLESAGPEARWFLAAETRFPSAGGFADVSCGLRGAHLERWGPPSLRPAYAAKARGFLDARCQTERLEVTGNWTLYILDSAIRLRYRNADGATVEERIHAKHDPGPDGARTQRIVRLGSPGTAEPPLQLVVPRVADLHLLTPALFHAGTLRVPEAVGALHWDRLHVDHARIDPFSAEGAFLLRADAYENLEIQGWTHARIPQTPAATVSSQAPAAPTALWALGLAVPLAWALLARLRRKDVEDHPVRRRLIELVGAEPGMSVQQVALRLGVRWTVADYHVRVLARHGRLVRTVFARGSALFPPSHAHGLLSARALALHRPPLRRLLLEMERRPTATQTEWARAIGVSQSWVSAKLRDLERLGLVTVRREGRRLRCQLTSPDEAPSGASS